MKNLYDEIRLRFSYDTNGFLVHNEINGEFHQHIGKMAGCVGSGGYVYITHKGKQYRAHRLIYLWHTGKLPDTDRKSKRLNSSPRCIS